jgi:hypothetical protein
MNFDASSPRADTTIAGVKFAIPQPFVPGMTIDQGAAHALNQLIRENVRNNLASRLKPAKEGEEAKGLTQEDVDAYVAEYQFGATRGGGGGERGLTPVERKARTIAREKVKVALAAKNIKLDLKTEAGKAKMEELVSTVAAKPEIIKLAEKQLRDTEKVSMDELDLAA